MNVFPFTAIVGQEDMKKALILNAINPNLGGVLIRGEKGTAKSTAARGLAFLLPEIEVVKDCRFNCHPYNIQNMCEECRNRMAKGEKLPIIRRRRHVVDLPLGATEDRVIGTLDIERAIKQGHKVFEPGILAEVNRGILYVDEVNLLDDHIVDVLLDAAAMGVNIVEREGISFTHPARFILIGTMNPEEGELRPQLLDRFGLCVEIKGITEITQRMEIVHRWMEFERDPYAFENRWQKQQDLLRDAILKAKEILPQVTYSDRILELVTRIATNMGVDGHRADIFMLKVAKTLASYHERTEIEDIDIKEAARLVLSHRMGRRPFKPMVDLKKIEQSIEQCGTKDKEQKNQSQDQNTVAERLNNGDKEVTRRVSSDAIFETGAPFQVRELTFPRDMCVKKGFGKRDRAKVQNRSGKYVRSIMPQDKICDVALDATIRAAAPYQMYREKDGLALAIKPPDIRRKLRERKIGHTILFVVDASGSMGANRRMIETKGAIFSLLIDAYQKRDRIGLIAFRRGDACLLVPPTF